MLTQQQLTKIKQTLETSQNPLFFYDNDADGLCAFLILRRSLDRGKGIAIKSFPDLKEQYIKKVDELQPDLIVILDKAELSKEFADQANQKNIPILWLDHHESKTKKETINKTHYYNTHIQKPISQAKPISQRSGLTGEAGLTAKRSGDEPVAYITQKIFNRQEDLWLAVTGCIADVYMPVVAVVSHPVNVGAIVTPSV